MPDPQILSSDDVSHDFYYSITPLIHYIKRLHVIIDWTMHHSDILAGTIYGDSSMC